VVLKKAVQRKAQRKKAPVKEAVQKKAEENHLKPGLVVVLKGKTSIRLEK